MAHSDDPARPTRAARSWRRTLWALHRDVGFVAVGLVLVYAISGVAVNHKHHWSYNYVTEVEQRQAWPETLLAAGGAPLPAPESGWSTEARGKLTRERQDEIGQRLGELLGHSGKPRNAFWRGPNRLSFFYGESDRDVVDYDPTTGNAARTWRKPRPLFRWVNALHLNEYRRVWTWVGDGFAVMLAFLAISGPLLVRGRQGLWGRGGLLALAGLLLPILAVLLLR